MKKLLIATTMAAVVGLPAPGAEAAMAICQCLKTPITASYDEATKVTRVKAAVTNGCASGVDMEAQVRLAVDGKVVGLTKLDDRDRATVVYEVLGRKPSEIQACVQVSGKATSQGVAQPVSCQSCLTQTIPQTISYKLLVPEGPTALR